MVYEIDPSITTPDDLRADPVLAEAADRLYAISQSGPRTAIPSSYAYLPFSHYSVPGELATLAASPFLKTITESSSLRDRILARRLLSEKKTKLGQIEFCFDVSNYNPHFESVPGKKYATMLQMLQYPFSKGSIHIPIRKDERRRTTSDDKPVIDPRYYADPRGELDYLTMVAAQRFAHQICSTKPLSEIIISRVFPPATHQEGGEDKDDFTDWVRNYTITDWHPVGTCAMGGKAGRQEGVVDERLKVYGVQGLRVVDASVMPLQISAHIQATVYAIGEKGASMILDDWRRK